MPSPPPDLDNVDIIAYDTVLVNSDDDIHTVSKTTLSTAMEHADYGAAGEVITYGNRPGRDLLAEHHETKEMMRRIEEQMAKNNIEIADLQNRVKVLTVASAGYRKVRHRFIDVYRRDRLDDIDKQGYVNIREGNIAAHEGDAITDASLYHIGERTDETVLLDIYGLNSSQISSVVEASNFASIAVLNAAATLKTKGAGSIPADVATTFEAFTKELKTNPGQSPTDGTSPLSKAYFAFWAAHQKYT